MTVVKPLQSIGIYIMNEVLYMNYVRGGLNRKQVVAVEIFGQPINIMEGKMCLGDIRKAYLSELGVDPSTSHTARIDMWLRKESTVSLIEFLESNLDEFGFESTDDVMTSKEGRYGGTFVCEELAHNYASWCDPRYAIYISRAFKELIRGNFSDAHKAASNVASPVVNLGWSDRLERIEAKGIDAKSYFRNIVKDIYYEISGSELDNATDFCKYIHKNIGENMVFEYMLNSMETAYLLVGSEGAAEGILEQYKDDPGYSQFEDLMKEYYENNN